MLHLIDEQINLETWNYKYLSNMLPEKWLSYSRRTDFMFPFKMDQMIANKLITTEQAEKFCIMLDADEETENLAIIQLQELLKQLYECR